MQVGIIRRRDLNEAQLRAVRALAQEFGIEADGWGRLQAVGPFGKRGGCGDDVLQLARR